MYEYALAENDKCIMNDLYLLHRKNPVVYLYYCPLLPQEIDLMAHNGLILK